MDYNYKHQMSPYLNRSSHAVAIHSKQTEKVRSLSETSGLPSVETRDVELRVWRTDGAFMYFLNSVYSFRIGLTPNVPPFHC